jgi:hypothetical protein
MRFDEAREALGFHCGRDPRVDDPRWRDGLLSTLRPYQGLRPDIMANVDECIDAVADHLCTAPNLDRDVVNSLWGIVHFARAWALHDDGMLKRNGLITADDARTIADWVDALSYRIAMMLDGGSDPKNKP